MKKTILLCHGSRDGWTDLAFHQRCDERGPTLTLVQSNRDGVESVFAAYAACDWISASLTTPMWPDPARQSFRFSLENSFVRPLKLTLSDRWTLHHSDCRFVARSELRWSVVSTR
jgi:hypothetical protein